MRKATFLYSVKGVENVLMHNFRKVTWIYIAHGNYISFRLDIPISV